MVFNATFNNISVISWSSNLLVGEMEYQEKTIFMKYMLFRFDKKFDMKMLIHQKEIIRLIIIAWDLLVTKYLKSYEYQFFFVFRFYA